MTVWLKLSEKDLQLSAVVVVTVFFQGKRSSRDLKFFTSRGHGVTGLGVDVGSRGHGVYGGVTRVTFQGGHGAHGGSRGSRGGSQVYHRRMLMRCAKSVTDMRRMTSYCV